MPDPSGMPGREGHRVRTADEQVTRVQAEPDRAAGQHALHIVSSLDHRADVRVQRGSDRTPACHQGKPVEVGEQDLPSGLVEHRPRVIPLGPGRGGEDERARACGGETLERLLDPRDWVMGGIVQDDRYEAADGA